MKKEKIVKILTIIVSLIMAIGLFITFLELRASNINSSAIVGLYLFHILPYLLIYIALIIYVIKSIINIIQNKVKITSIDIAILVLFICSFISSLFSSLYLHMQG
jgi:hypothetical protein